SGKLIADDETVSGKVAKTQRGLYQNISARSLITPIILRLITFGSTLAYEVVRSTVIFRCFVKISPKCYFPITNSIRKADEGRKEERFHESIKHWSDPRVFLLRLADGR